MKIHEAVVVGGEPFVSLEFFPPRDRAVWDGFFEVAQKLKAVGPLFASVTYGAGGSTRDHTVEIAAHLKHSLHIETMPHLTCVGATKASIAKYLEQLQGVGIQNIMALRGDPPRDSEGGQYDWSKGEFASSLDLIRFIRKQAPGMAIGVGGYPAPHPESPTIAQNLDFMRQKVEAGADFIVTQLFFDHREYVDYVARLHTLGVMVPVIPGVLPIQSLDSVRRTLSMCGATIPGKFYLELEAANTADGPAAVREAGIDFAVNQCRTLLKFGAPGIHLYTLNRAGMCLRIAEEAGLIQA